MAVSLSVRTREERGKGSSRRLRSAGMVPAVFYGHGDEPRRLAVPTRDLEKLLATISAENTIIDLVIEGESPTPALIREVQHHPSRPELLHVDFFHIHAGEKLTVDVPVRLHGNPIGVRDFGGVLDQVLYALHVECLPRNIPQSVDFDVENLGVGDSVHVRDANLPNVKILNDGDLVICTVGAPTTAALPEGPETDRGVGGEVDTELVRSRRADAEDVPFEHGSRQPE